MADFNFNDLGDGLRTIFLAGVGAVSATAERGQQLVEELVKKGELTVDQGKVLNSELSRKAKGAAKDAFAGAQDAAAKAREAVDDVKDAALKARLAVMSDEERASYVARVAKLAEAVDAEKAAAKAKAEAEAAADGAAEGEGAESGDEPDAVEPAAGAAGAADADDDAEASAPAASV